MEGIPEQRAAGVLLDAWRDLSGRGYGALTSADGIGHQSAIGLEVQRTKGAGMMMGERQQLMEKQRT